MCFFFKFEMLATLHLCDEFGYIVILKPELSRMIYNRAQLELNVGEVKRLISSLAGARYVRQEHEQGTRTARQDQGENEDEEGGGLVSGSSGEKTSQRKNDTR